MAAMRQTVVKKKTSAINSFDNTWIGRKCELNSKKEIVLDVKRVLKNVFNRKQAQNILNLHWTHDDDGQC